MPALFVRLPNHLGDACMTVPALDLLAAHGVTPTLVGRAWARDLFAAYPWQSVPLPGGWRARAAALRAALAPLPDAGALLFTNSFGSALDFFLARRRASGFATDGRALLLRRAVPVPAAWRTGLHMVDYYWALACAFLGVKAPVPPRLDLKVAPAAFTRARALLDGAGVGEHYVVLCPVAVGLHRGRVKAWDGFGRLSEALRAQGHRVLACPGPGELDVVKAALGATAIVLPSTDVGTFAALLAQSRLVVANDSGPGHVAAAVGARLVSVFGVTEPVRTRPWGTSVTLVGSDRGWPTYAQVERAVEEALA